MPPIRSLRLVGIALLTLFTCQANALYSHANFGALCEETRADLIHSGTYNQSHDDLSRLNCGQKFDDSIPSAISINITLATCLAKAPGYERSHKAGQWAAPLFGFLLPAVAFILAIGRPARLKKFDSLIFLKMKSERDAHEWKAGRAAQVRRFAWGNLMLVAGLLLTMLSVILDTTLWYIAVFVFAGPLIAGTVYKAVNDFSIVRHLRRKMDHNEPVYGLDRYLLVVILVGTFDFDKNGLGDTVKEGLKKPREAKAKLMHLFQQIPSFGTPIFGPAIFYLGAFVFGLFDAQDRRGDNDTANAIAFGIWYGVILLVAILACATIGVENPFTINYVFGPHQLPIEPRLLAKPPQSQQHQRMESVTDAPVFVSDIWHGLNEVQDYVTGDTEELAEEVPKSPLLARQSEEIPFAYFDDARYVTVWLGQRHISFRRWMIGADSFPDAQKPGFFRHLQSTWRRRIFAFVTAVVLVTIPCGLASSTSYFTPTVGFGCHSVTVFSYLVSQLLLITTWLIDPDDPNPTKHALRRTLNLSLIILASLGGAFVTVGGTVMQLVGVYRNCVCKAGLRFAFNSAGGVVELATDTEVDRESWRIWWFNGIGALAFFGAVLTGSCFYNMWMKESCKTIIKDERFGQEAGSEVELRKFRQESDDGEEEEP